MPRYLGVEWGDSGYDAVDHLIDNDPSELAKWFRRSLETITDLVEAIEVDGCRVDSNVAAPYVTAQTILRQWREATAVMEAED